MKLYSFRELTASRTNAKAGCENNRFNSLQTVALWAMDYLRNSHQDLGRSGPVCPWAGPSMKLNLFFVGALDASKLSSAEIEEEIIALISKFAKYPVLECKDQDFKTFIVVLENLENSWKVEEFHHLLKPLFLSAGLMLGEFFIDCNKGGIRNQTFKPLQSPLPLLVVREMIEFDVLFLADSVQFVMRYLEKHGAVAASRYHNFAVERRLPGWTQDHSDNLLTAITQFEYRQGEKQRIVDAQDLSLPRISGNSTASNM